MSINRSSSIRITKSVCVAVAVLAGVLSVSFSYAAHNGDAPNIIEVRINGLLPVDISCQNPLTSGLVSFTGFGEGSAPPGKVEQYDVAIDFGDGSPVVSTQAKFTPPCGSHKDFVFEFGDDPPFLPGDNPPVEHVYLAGNDSTVDSMLEFVICILDPDPPALNVELISPDPLSFSCPDNPFSRPATVTIGGSGAGSSVGGDVTDWEVEVDWDDGTVELASSSTFLPSGIIVGDHTNFTLAFESLPHPYTVDGPHPVTISVVSSGGPGDLSEPVEGSIQLCTFTPVEPALRVDSINGQAPETITCENPISNPVTIVGSGEGSATIAGVENFLVTVDWDDDSPFDVITPTFNPSSGTGVIFIYDFLAEHTYTVDRTYLVSFSLFDFDPIDRENVLVATETVEICFLAPKGTITAKVTDFTTGLPIFGATVEDITQEPAIHGSFAGGSIFALHSPGRPPESDPGNPPGAPGPYASARQVGKT